MRPSDPRENSRDPLQAEPSMSAPSPMPGRPAASYVKKQAPAPAPQADWQPPREQPAPPQYPNSGSYPGYYPQQSYPAPSQGIPGGQAPAPQYGWQQGYTPAQSSQPYTPPSGRGWTQPYPQQNASGTWQGGYTVNPWAGNGYVPGGDGSYGAMGGGSGSMPAGGSASGGGHSSGNGRRPVSRTALLKLIAAAAAVLIAIAVSVLLLVQQHQNKLLHEAVSAYQDRYCQGVYVDGIHLGGMTREEARTTVQKSAQLKCDEWHVRLETPIGEYVGEINSYHLGMSVNVDDALNEAWKQGHTGTDVNERKKQMDALLETPYHGNTALPSGDTSVIDSILQQIAGNIYAPAVDAYIESFTPNATNPFVYVEGTVGRYLDIASIRTQVYDMVSRMETGVILIEPTPLYPTVTKADLVANTTLIGTHYTKISTTSTENRDLNIQRACDSITGTIIEPGRTFSFNDVVGPRTQKNGYYKATVYNYGKEEEGYGGGVCQVSSTMYVAAIRANMEIVTRRQHGLIVGYTDLGLDATVNYDGKKIDFSFRNNTDSPIYIVTKVMRIPKIDKSRDLVICEIYGPALEQGVTYDLVATQIEVPIPEPTVVPDKEAAHVVYTDDPPHTEPGKIGYEVDSYKVKYVNGEEVERTHMYHDSYAPVQPVTYVGVSVRPLPSAEPW